MIETPRAEGGTSQDCHPVPKWPTLPSILIPLLGNGSREYGGGCVYLDISTWRYHICCPHPCLPHTSRAAWSQILGQQPGPGLPALVLLSSPLCDGQRSSRQCPWGRQGGEPHQEGLAGSSAAPTASRHEVTTPAGSPARTEWEPRSGPFLRLSTGGKCSHLLSYRLWLFHAYKIPGQQDLDVDRFYVIEIHNVGCKHCVIGIGAVQHRAAGW